MYERFAEWLDYSLNAELPDDLVAFCFNLYEEENSTWSVELIGSPDFDGEDGYWACHEAFDNREYPLRWQEEAEWEDIHNKIETYIRQYLVTGQYAEVLKGYQAVAMGFVEGDLTIVYQSKKSDAVKNCLVCGEEMQKGIVKVQDSGFLNNVILSWYPDADKGKLFQKNAVPMRLKGTGYYCRECMKVYAEFEEK